MVEISPLNAIIYNKKKVNISDVTAPPYDIIDSKYKEILLRKSEYNITNLILPNSYEKAGILLGEWLQNSVLVQYPTPAIFYLIQRYKNNEGTLIEREGFIAGLKIEDFSQKHIFPHEKIMPAPKQDRLNLVTATNTFFSQIFMVYKDDEKKIEKEVFAKYRSKKPFICVMDDFGVENIVYSIEDKNEIQLIETVIKDKNLLIADGHHRYDTAMSYLKEHPNNDRAKYVMTYFTNSLSKNLEIYPIHRIIEKDIQPERILDVVKRFFEIDKYSDKNEFLQKINNENKKQITIGLILKNDSNYYVLKWKEDKEKLSNEPEVLQKLDLTILHKVVLKELGFSEKDLAEQKGIKYEKQENIVFEATKYNASACFIMASPKIENIIDVSINGFKMPQKSTYFYPKLLSGLIINKLK